jgi:hypothetical protein
MRNGGEIIYGVPLIEQAAAEIARTGQFQQQLTSRDLTYLVGGVMSSLGNGQAGIQAAIERMNIQIVQNQGFVDGALRVQSPVNASIEMRWSLANDPRDPSRSRIMTTGLTTAAETHGFMGMLASGLVDIQSEVQTRAAAILGNPNVALYKSLDAQLRARGVALAGQNLQFVNNNLFIGLSGNRLR